MRRCHAAGDWGGFASARRRGSASVPASTAMANARHCGRHLRSIGSDAGCCTSSAPLLTSAKTLDSEALGRSRRGPSAS